MFERFSWSDPAYAEAFATLLRASGERPYLERFLRNLIVELPSAAVAVDWGAGSGDLCRLLLERCGRVMAVEPATEMRKALRQNHPQVELIDGELFTAEPGVAADIAILSHVLYHVPDEQWGAAVLRLAERLTPQGVLVVILKNAYSGCSQMLADFGAPRFDLVGSLADTVARHPEFDFRFTRLPGGIRTTNFDDTLAIARFLLCDRPAEAFLNAPSEAEFQSYVGEHFWNETSGHGGWDYQLMVCLVKRNPLASELAASS